MKFTTDEWSGAPLIVLEDSDIEAMKPKHHVWYDDEYGEYCLLCARPKKMSDYRPCPGEAE